MPFETVPLKLGLVAVYITREQTEPDYDDAFDDFDHQEVW